MGLEEDIASIRNGIKAGSFANEASVSQGIVLRLLSRLGWDTYDTKVVCPEFSLSGRRVDFALCHPPGKPVAFVEVKQIGQSDGAERQLFEYAFHSGIPLAILTDGQEWNFFLPGEQGDYGERRVYKLDLVEREVQQCVERFERYLLHGNVASGAAIRNAREDYQDVAKKRQIRAALPEAWRRLINDEDELLLEVLADKVESLCGFKPAPDTVANFLKASVTGGNISPSIQPITKLQKTFATTPQSAPVACQASPASVKPALAEYQAVGFTLQGVRHSASNGRDVLQQVFEELTKLDPAFPERFAALPRHGKKRRYLARNPEDLYPGRPDLSREHSLQLKSGWWLGTNHSKSAISQIIEMASGVAGMHFGTDLQVFMGN